jgi:hypothetical protein
MEMAKAGESLSAQDLEVLESASVEPAEDVDVDSWLADQQGQALRTASVNMGGKLVKIAAIDEQEENNLMRASRRPKRNNPNEQEMDMLLFRRNYIAFSLAKAQGQGQVKALEYAEKLKSMLPGVLTKLQMEIQKLSAYEIPSRADSPFSFIGD